jgi:hypothetical protein
METISKSVSKEHRVIRKKVMKGVRLSFIKLVKEKSLRDEELVFSENGKIRFVKARKIKI